MQISSNKPHWEAPRDYVGELPTTGKGVGVVVMDEGFDLTHPDLKGRVMGVQTSTTDRFDHDPLGHGTHTLGILGASGESSDGRIRGLAPDANLIAMKVHLAQGEGLPDSIASIERGMKWAVENKDKFNIKVINCSFVLPTLEVPDPENGGGFIPTDPLAYALNLAKEAGIVVVAGVGNFADKNAIVTPAGDPSVIAVGALNTGGTPEDKSDDTVAKFSSRGKSIYGEEKPDILAPGVGIMAPNAAGSQSEKKTLRNGPIAEMLKSAPYEKLQRLATKFAEKGKIPQIALRLPEASLRKIMGKLFEVDPTLGDNQGSPAYIGYDGTSQSAPIVAGVVANMFEANQDLTPEQVREILYSTANPVAGVGSGHGAIDPQAAIERASNISQT